MKTFNRTNLTVLAAVLSSFILHPSSLGQGTAFTYQGRLNANGAQANGNYDLAFALFATNVTGKAIAGPVTNVVVGVSNGLFTTTVDFGGAFTGASNWLEIAVSSNGANGFTTLAPRQQLTPTPYALYAQSANSLGGTLSASQLTSIGNNGPGASGNFFVGPSGNATTSGGENTANGSGALHSNTSGYDNTANGDRALFYNTSGDGNTANGAQALFLNTSGSDNTANGAQALGLNTNGSFNTANGGLALSENRSGSYNTANGNYALYSNTRGSNNTANGFRALYSNNSSGNTADGFSALFHNTGGSNNIALGYAAGLNITTGSSNIDIGNQGVATDTNIIRIGDVQTQTWIAGAVYATVFNPTSDRNAKQNFQAVSGREVLEKVVALPVSRWNYKQDTSSQHIGPMAQDFHAAFGVGLDDKHIATVDADGVALAAIQGLNQKLESQVKDKEARIQALEKDVAQLKAMMSSMLKKSSVAANP